MPQRKQPTNRYWSKFKGEKKDCDRCGFTYYKTELNKIAGKWLCDDCVDEDEKS